MLGINKWNKIPPGGCPYLTFLFLIKVEGVGEFRNEQEGKTSY
jgi:hypothetical protein